VIAHGVYADELRALAGLGPNDAICSKELSETHRQLAIDHDTTQWLHRPEVYTAAAATREANDNEDQRRRRISQLDNIRPHAIKALQHALQIERADPAAAAARKLARSKARRAFRTGAECPICGAWFCSLVKPGTDYRQRTYCSDTCLREGMRRLRRRAWMRQTLAHQTTGGGTAAGRSGRQPPGS
jgi:hypothetical protein